MSEAAFTDAFALLAAAADVKGFEARISRLKKLSEQVAAEQAHLEADRAEHARTVAAAVARETALRAREVQVALGEHVLAKGREELAAARRELAPSFFESPNLEPGSRSHSGLSREPYRE